MDFKARLVTVTPADNLLTAQLETLRTAGITVQGEADGLKAELDDFDTSSEARLDALRPKERVNDRPHRPEMCRWRTSATGIDRNELAFGLLHCH